MKEIITTSAAPAAIGPYSQAVKADRFVYISGQLPLDPQTGKLIEGDIAAQTERILANIEAIASAAGARLDDIVKTTIFLTDLGNFTAVNETYGRFFTDAPPARSTIQVAALPLGAAIEIEAVVLLPQTE